MAQFFQIHPDNPQSRLLRQTIEIINQGGVVCYPTDSSYALGCQIGNKSAVDRIRQIRRLDNKHNFTLVCSNLAEISQYTKLNNQGYRLIKSLTPGPYTFILPATKQVPRRLMHPKRKTIGIRIPDNKIALELIETLADNPTITIELMSHTDNRGQEEDNNELSQKRAQSVVDYLIERGIDPARLSATGYGEGMPKVITNRVCEHAGSGIYQI